MAIRAISGIAQLLLLRRHSRDIAERCGLAGRSLRSSACLTVGRLLRGLAGAVGLTGTLFTGTRRFFDFGHFLLARLQRFGELLRPSQRLGLYHGLGYSGGARLPSAHPCCRRSAPAGSTLNGPWQAPRHSRRATAAAGKPPRHGRHTSLPGCRCLVAPDCRPCRRRCHRPTRPCRAIAVASARRGAASSTGDIKYTLPSRYS